MDIDHLLKCYVIKIKMVIYPLNILPNPLQLPQLNILPNPLQSPQLNILPNPLQSPQQFLQQQQQIIIEQLINNNKITVGAKDSIIYKLYIKNNL